MLHNLPPLPPIKGGDESTFPRASSARKYIQTDDDEGFEENAIPGQVEDTDGKVKKEVQFKTRGESIADGLGEDGDHNISMESIPSRPARRLFFCCCRRPKKSSSDKKSAKEDDEEQIIVSNDKSDEREEIEIHNNGSDRSTVEFQEASSTDR